MTSIPYRVVHNLDTDATHTVERTYERQIDGKWYAYAVIGGLVFRNKQAFNTQLEAYRFNLVTKREGAHVQ